jgi:hypothetical protein
LYCTANKLGNAYNLLHRIKFFNYFHVFSNQTFFQIKTVFSSVIPKATVGMFDWRLFDNSNRTKVVWRPKKLGCLTQIMFNGKLTIVEHKINRTKLERWLCSINSYFGFENGQLSNIKLIKLNQESDYVWLMLCSTNVMFNNAWKLYILCWTKQM